MNTRLVKEEDVEFKPSNDDLVSVPLYGKIAAGTPIEAIATEQNMVDVPMGFLGSSECYALEIEGDSMMKAGIMDGDIVLIERCNTASDGDIIVALVDGEEATLKRLRREIGKVILQPENDSYQPIMLDAARVQIQGKLKTLYRHY
jgi:repressor LexA